MAIDMHRLRHQLVCILRAGLPCCAHINEISDLVYTTQEHPDHSLRKKNLLHNHVHSHVKDFFWPQPVVMQRVTESLA